jgi:hypothetical protein
MMMMMMMMIPRLRWKGKIDVKYIWAHEGVEMM